jgi:hypothetical protein
MIVSEFSVRLHSFNQLFNYPKKKKKKIVYKNIPCKAVICDSSSLTFIKIVIELKKPLFSILIFIIKRGLK